MNPISKWVAGARPRTLPAAISPVLVGTALAYRLHTTINYFNALLALLVSLALQIAVNYANDYSDGIKGTDEKRVGPIRLVGSGLASPKAVKAAAFLSFGFAGVVGAYLATRTSYVLILVGLVAIFAAWTYTGTSKPYGYQGLGELSVFIFFGIVATMGTYFAATKIINWQSFLLAIPVGALSCALLAINNLRDLPKDALVGKRTLAVRLGEVKARAFFIFLLLLGHATALLAMIVSPWTFFTLFLLPLTWQISKEIVKGARGVDLIPLLGKTGRLQLLLSTILALTLLI
jgi:1,4-dihydroxy-2-naphthoate octaprenyltransferase